jgi:hypothetical protein
MDRRTFVKHSLATVSGSALGAGLGMRNSFGMGRGNYAGQPPIKYFQNKIPGFDVPPYRGERYEDMIPDTLDIASRAELGVGVLTNIADPKLDYEVYWIAQWDRNPAVMVHNNADWVQSVEGLDLAKEIYAEG